MEENKSVENNAEGWVYVFVCDPGSDESYFGLYNDAKDLNFIPVFRSREEANDCFLDLPRKKGVKYECQAVHLEEISEAAEKNGFAVAIVDADGKVVKE